MDTWSNLARTHGTVEWTFDDLQKAIHMYSEIHILEMVQVTSSNTISLDFNQLLPSL